MLTPTRAVDLFLGDLTRRSRSNSGRTEYSYGLLLDKFTELLDRKGPDIDVTDITADDCRLFLNKYARHSAGYQHTIYSTLNSFLDWLDEQHRIKRNPLDHVARPRRIRAEDLDVISVSTSDVPKLFSKCQTDAERIALAILAYLGPRRNATAGLRLSDYDQDEGLIRFREKGSKTIWKPAPDELVVILDAAIARGALANEWQPDDPYLIPPEGPLSRPDARDDRVIWRLVKKVAARAGVEAHVHALRAAFATFYLETHENDIVGLQELMGHASIETTKLYLRKLNKRRAMEPVRGLSWAAVGEGNMADELLAETAVNTFKESVVVGAGGFEPPQAEPTDDDRAGSKPRDSEDPARPAVEGTPALDRKLSELSKRAAERRRSRQ